jgi:pimeloyl-ACP methyl ester carboxylesterase
MPNSDPDDPTWTDEGSGPPLVFIHGFPFSRDCWQPQVDGLSSSYRVIAPNLPGFGGRQGAAGAATMDAFADDVASLLADLDTGPVVLAGHSMGGYVALAFARRHADLLRGLVLIATRSGPDSPEVAAGRRAAAEKVSASGIDAMVDGMVPKMLAPVHRNPESLAALREFMMSSSRDGVIGALLGMANRPDSTPGLAGISIPTLVVTGADDEVIAPAESEALAAAIPGARLRVLPDAGHMVAWEQPEAFARELRDWLAGDSDGPPP